MALVINYPVNSDDPPSHYYAQRYQWGDVAVDAIGGRPTQGEIDAFTARPSDQVIDDYLNPPWKVATYTIIRRLEEAGLIEAADAALSQNKTLWRRFYTVGKIDSNAPDAIAFITAIGGDPKVILAKG